MSCSNCSKPASMRCGQCRGVCYCCRECQVAHFPAHREACKKVKQAQERVEHEIARISNPEDENFMDEDPFQTQVGHFWGHIETRDYMRARYKYVERLQDLGTSTAIQDGINNLLDMLRLCRSDNMGVRYKIPGLYLRLGGPVNVQKCYDFCKWWLSSDEDGRYDWGNTSLPYLNIKDADQYECITKLPSLFSGYGDLNMTLSILYIKTKLYLEASDFTDSARTLMLCMHRQPAALSGIRSRDIFAHILEYIWPVSRALSREALRLRASTTAGASSSKGASQIMALKDELQMQINEIVYLVVNKANKFLLPLLVEPEQYKRLPLPDSYSHGSQEQAVLALKDAHELFYGPGTDERVIEIIKQALPRVKK